MDPDELFALVKKHPFEPFRIHVSDGNRYDVKHPDQIVVGRRSCHVGIAKNGEGPFQRIAIVSNIHITRLEPLDDEKRQHRRK